MPTVSRSLDQAHIPDPVCIKTVQISEACTVVARSVLSPGAMFELDSQVPPGLVRWS